MSKEKTGGVTDSERMLSFVKILSLNYGATQTPTKMTGRSFVIYLQYSEITYLYFSTETTLYLK
jgi:hypothetical protein